jgi:hypothetical protein
MPITIGEIRISFLNIKLKWNKEIGVLLKLFKKLFHYGGLKLMSAIADKNRERVNEKSPSFARKFSEKNNFLKGKCPIFA